MSKNLLASRILSYDVLNATIHSHQPFDDAFDKMARRRKLDPRDRAFAYHLTITTLRRLGQIDDLIKSCLDKKLPPKAGRAKAIMRLGVCQLLFMETPDHAAVNTSVDLAEKMDQGPYKKLINAVLRRIGRENKKLLQQQDVEKLNTPEWLWQSWCTAYGEDVTRKIASAHLIQPALDITTKSDADGWAKKLEGQLLSTGSIRLASSSNVTDLEGFDAGEWWVQDAAAHLPVKLLGDDLKGQKILDMCAAPGGKTAQLLAAGALVTALDRSEKRLATLTENLARLSVTAETICADATTWQSDTKFDAILIDAPCSSTGTIRRHPDVAFLKQPKDVDHVQGVQSRLLASAASMVKKDGKIIYATCSLQPEEGAQIIDAFLDSHTDWERVPVTSEDVGCRQEVISSDGDLRTLPCHFAESGGLDGFFAARLICR